MLVEASGLASVRTHLDYYRAFACFRASSILQGVYKRALSGQGSSAQGKAVGTSLVEDDFIQTAKDAMKLAEEKGCELIFPNEILVADAFDANANTQVVSSDAIPDGWMGLDNGPAATKMIQDKLDKDHDGDIEMDELVPRYSRDIAEI